MFEEFTGLTLSQLELREIELREELRSMNEDDNGNLRTLGDKEQREFDRKMNSLRYCQRLIDKHRRIGDLARHPGNRIPGDASTRPAGEPIGTSPARGAALRMVEEMHRDTRAVLDDAAAQRLTTLIERDASKDDRAAEWALLAGAPDYRSAFGALLADPQNGHRTWTPQQLDAFRAAQDWVKRAMSTTTSASPHGGYLLPVNLDPMINLSSAGVVDPIRQLARHVTITAGDKWLAVSSAGVTAEWIGEGGEVADATPDLAQPEVPVFKADAFVPFSVEIGDEAELVTQLQRLFADAKANLEGAAWINGNGTSQPKGIMTAFAAASLDVDPTTAEAFSAADVYAVLEAVPARFRGSTTWLAELSTLNKIDQFETTNGAKKFPNISDANPTLLRRPVREVSAMDAYSDIDAAATANNRILAAVDLSQYAIVDRVGTTVELVPHLFGNNNRPTLQRGLIMWWRVGADFVIPGAGRVLNVATTA